MRGGVVPGTPGPQIDAAATTGTISAELHSAMTRAAGSITVATVPTPLVLSIDSDPPCSSASWRTNGSPRPVPSWCRARPPSIWPKGFHGDLKFLRRHADPGIAYGEGDAALRTAR